MRSDLKEAMLSELVLMLYIIIVIFSESVLMLDMSAAILLELLRSDLMEATLSEFMLMLDMMFTIFSEFVETLRSFVFMSDLIEAILSEFELMFVLILD